MIAQIVRCAVLASWAGFFLWLICFGQSHLSRLLHPGLWWLVVSAAVILLFFLAVAIAKPGAGNSSGPIFWQLPSLAILLVPLLFFTHAQNARFNADTFSKRTILPKDAAGENTDGSDQKSAEISLDTISSAQGEATDRVKRPTDQSGKEDDLTDDGKPSDIPLTKLVFNLESYLGKEVEVVCQTFVDVRVPKGFVLCYRYLVTCCAADAMPVPIYLKPRQGLIIKNDTWIRAKGILAMKKNAGVTLPLLTVEAIQYVQEPTFPYIF